MQDLPDPVETITGLTANFGAVAASAIFVMLVAGFLLWKVCVMGVKAMKDISVTDNETHKDIVADMKEHQENITTGLKGYIEASDRSREATGIKVTTALESVSGTNERILEHLRKQ